MKAVISVINLMLAVLITTVFLSNCTLMQNGNSSSSMTSSSSSSVSSVSSVSTNYVLNTRWTNMTTNVTGTNMFLVENSNFMISNFNVCSNTYIVSNALTNGIIIFSTTNESIITNNTFSITNYYPVWHYLGSFGFAPVEASWNSMVIDNGIPYVAFQNVASRRANIMIYSNQAWSYMGNQDFYSNELLQTIFAIENGIPYIAFQDGGINGIYSGFARIGTALVFSNGSWTTVGAQSFTSIIDGTDCLDFAVNNNILYAAYSDYSTANHGVTVKYFNGSIWTNLGVSGFTVGRANYLCLAFSNQTPNIACWDCLTNLRVLYYSNGTWADIGNPGYINGKYLSFVNYNGFPYIAFSDSDSYVRLMVFTNNTWVTIGTQKIVVYSGDYDPISLAFHNGIPYIGCVTRDTNSDYRLSVIMYSNNNWQYLGDKWFSRGLADFVDLQFYNNIPYISFKDYPSGYPSVMIYQ